MKNINYAYDLGNLFVDILNARSQRLNNDEELDDERFIFLRFNVDHIAQGEGPDVMAFKYDAKFDGDKELELTKEEETEICQKTYDTLKEVYHDVIELLQSYYQKKIDEDQLQEQLMEIAEKEAELQ